MQMPGAANGPTICSYGSGRREEGKGRMPATTAIELSLLSDAGGGARNKLGGVFGGGEMVSLSLHHFPLSVPL